MKGMYRTDPRLSTSSALHPLVIWGYLSNGIIHKIEQFSPKRTNVLDPIELKVALAPQREFA